MWVTLTPELVREQLDRFEARQLMRRLAEVGDECQREQRAERRHRAWRALYEAATDQPHPTLALRHALDRVHAALPYYR